MVSNLYCICWNFLGFFIGNIGEYYEVCQSIRFGTIVVFENIFSNGVMRSC